MTNLAGLSVQNEENPNGDIEIKIVGLRPGEKLHEELLIGENVEQTSHPKILLANEDYIHWNEVTLIIERLKLLIKKNDVVGVLAILRQNVEGFEHMLNDK